MRCPCRDCEKAGCGPFHDECERFQEWKAWKDEVNKQKAKDQTCKDLPRACKTAWYKHLKEKQLRGG